MSIDDAAPPSLSGRHSSVPDHEQEPLRISIIAPCWFTVPPQGYGGIELVVGLLADGLIARGHDVTLFASPGSRTSARLVTPLPEQPDPSDLGDIWHETHHALAAFLHDTPADVIHDHTGPVGATIAATRGDRVPVVHTLHGPWTDDAKRFYELLDDRIGLVAISESQRAASPHVRHAGVVHNGVDLRAFRVSAEKDSSLVFVGRANPDKNPAGAIDIARRAGRPLRMFVKCNEPAEHDYWKREIEPRLGSDVEVLMDAPEDVRVDAVARAAAKIFPIQWDEPFGLVMVEAMACGTPVIATPRGAATEIVDHGRTGFLCDTPEQMAAAVGWVDDLSPDECRAHVVDRFSAEAMVAGYERVYRAAVARRAPR